MAGSEGEVTSRIDVSCFLLLWRVWGGRNHHIIYWFLNQVWGWCTWGLPCLRSVRLFLIVVFIPRSIWTSDVNIDSGEKHRSLVEFRPSHVRRFTLLISQSHFLVVGLKQKPCRYWITSIFILEFVIMACTWWQRDLEIVISQRPSWWFCWPFKIFYWSWQNWFFYCPWLQHIYHCRVGLMKLAIMSEDHWKHLQCRHWVI